MDKNTVKLFEKGEKKEMKILDHEMKALKKEFKDVKKEEKLIKKAEDLISKAKSLEGDMMKAVHLGNDGKAKKYHNQLSNIRKRIKKLVMRLKEEEKEEGKFTKKLVEFQDKLYKLEAKMAKDLDLPSASIY